MNGRISQALKLNGLDLDSVSALASAVKELSDQYVNEEGSLTPWKNSKLALAYITYFMPLNAARLANAWREVQRFGVKFSEIWDVGSGPGTLHWMLEDSDSETKPLYSVERSNEALRFHQLLGRGGDRWLNQWKNKVESPRAGALGVFSYSLLELKSTDLIEKFDHVLILEPSTQTRGRKLMEVRAQLLESGYKILAPCTHQGTCPLLTQSERDWCHQRFEWFGPPWWKALESELPMKNRTLTYSYLLASRTTVPGKFAARVIGDTLYERGKVRQMICRGENREFLSWLTREGEPRRIPHGALLISLPQFELKSNELRVVSEIDWQN